MSHFLKVVTYNLANYDDWAEWDTRKQMLAQILIDADADVILLQEVRFNPDHPSTTASYQNMAEQILFEMHKKDKYVGAFISTLPIAFYPLEKRLHVPVPKKLSTFGEKVEWEGLSIISKYFISEEGSQFLTRPGQPVQDLNPRANQYVAIDFPIEVGQTTRVYFFNAHFSYVIPDALDNADKTIAWIKRVIPPETNGLYLLAGDLNVEPSQSPYAALINSGVVTDMWPFMWGADNAGLTFRTWEPIKRIDFILPSKQLLVQAKEIKMIGDKANPTNAKIFASDHRALLATFNVSILGPDSMKRSLEEKDKAAFLETSVMKDFVVL